MDSIVCNRCAVISRGIVGNCSHVNAMLDAERLAIARAVASQKFTVNIGTADRRSQVEIPIGTDVAEFINSLERHY